MAAEEKKKYGEMDNDVRNDMGNAAGSDAEKGTGNVIGKDTGNDMESVTEKDTGRIIGDIVEEAFTDAEKSPRDLPTAAQLKQEMDREQHKFSFRRTLRGVVFTLITVSAVAMLVAMLFLPVLQIYGSSMTPTLEAGDTVVSIKTTDFETGDIIAFYLTSNRVLIKRVIATAGQWVDMDADGRVYVDGILLDEPYVDEFAYGECDIDLPYQVPDGQIFVMGDHRATSVDSRSTSIGCVTEDQIVGKVVFRVWPLSGFGVVE